MRCPFCGFEASRVIDSRQNQGATRIRRRRECESCDRRFTTYEVQETVEVLVLKKDGRREPLDKSKLTRGIERACSKRPVPYEQIEEMAESIVSELSNALEREVPVRRIGGMVLDRLRQVDPVAYVRFLSVYREFSSVQEFLDELRQLVEAGRLSAGSGAG